MKRYLLEIGQLLPADLGYSYYRRAQATTEVIKWTDDAMSDSFDALEERFNLVYGKNHMDARILDRETNEYIVINKENSRNR